MTKDEAIAWLKGERSMINLISSADPDQFQVNVAVTDAAMMKQAYLILKAHKEGLLEVENKPDTKQDEPEWYPLKDAPKDGTLLLLKVEGGDNHTSDAPVWITIGSNTSDHTDLVEPWQMAGWDWTNDKCCEGYGIIVGWRYLPGQEPATLTSCPHGIPHRYPCETCDVPTPVPAPTYTSPVGNSFGFKSGGKPVTSGVILGSEAGLHSFTLDKRLVVAKGGVVLNDGSWPIGKLHSVTTYDPPILLADGETVLYDNVQKTYVVVNEATRAELRQGKLVTTYF